MQIWFAISVSSLSVVSISTEAVIMDVTDMLVGEDHMCQLMQGRG